MEKGKILVLTDWYEPGFKAGGPIRSCVNFASYMKENYEIFILTSDRDLGDEQAYPGISTGKWLNKDGTHIFYGRDADLAFANLRNLVSGVSPNFIYLNSLFSKRFTIFPLMMNWKGDLKPKIILAPRGMLRSSALAFKKTKKQIFLLLFKILGIQKKVRWQATDEQEVRDIKQRFSNAEVVEAGNFPAARQNEPPAFLQKEKGRINIVFVGRIHPIKNLHFLLQVLKHIRGRVKLEIVGSIEDEAYWKTCQHEIGLLPENIEVNFLGEMSHDRLLTVLQRSHIFALPTTGENFGHAIYEALAAGRPVVISDQTPWRHLSVAKAGWDIPLSKAEEFIHAIEEAAGWDQQIFDQWSNSAWNFAGKSVDSNGLMNTYKKLFS